jgi:very-short-patch-repair endonuclease
MEGKNDNRWQRLVDLAVSQHGTAAVWQMRQVGLSLKWIESQVRADRLHRIFQGVYSVGHWKLTREGRLMAGVLACGPKAVLSHWSAAAYWGLLQTSRAVIDVVVIGSRNGPKAVKTHRVRHLDPRDITIRDGIPITTVPRTLLDLATVANQRQLRRAVNEAVRKRWLHQSAVEDILRRHKGRPGIAAFRAATAALNPGTHRTRSDLEDAFLTLCRKHRLPTPDSNVAIAGYEVDFHFPGTNVIVELDSYEYHRTPAEFDADRRKWAALKRKGYAPLPVSDAWLNSDPEEVAATVRQLLSAYPAATEDRRAESAAPPAPTGADASEAPRCAMSSSNARSTSGM